MTSGERAWLALLAGVVGYNVAASPGNMLSEAADVHPWIARGVGLIVYLHVANLIPARRDPIHWAFVAVKGRR